MIDGVTIDRIRETTGLDRDNKPVTRLEVEFRIGVHGPFFEMFSKGEFTEATLRERVQPLVTEFRALGLLESRR